jgi:hypothetical protein
MTAMRDALGKGSVGGELQHAAQFGLTDEDEGGQGLAVELGSEQGAEGIDEQVGQKMSLIDHDHRRFALSLNEIGEHGAEGGVPAFAGMTAVEPKGTG